MKKKLKKEIEEKLGAEINGDYCILDIPKHYNVGDILIWLGELEFLNKLNFKQKYSCSCDYFDEKKIGKKDVILLHGGGNLGDVWGKHQEFRERVIGKFKKNKIVIFPQTVYFNDKTKLRKAVKIFSKHDNLTICARDKKSYEILRNNFNKNKILLIPDMAFFLDKKKILHKYSISNSKNKHKPHKKILFLMRRDRELKKDNEIPFINQLEIKDWQGFDSFYFTITYNLINLINKGLWRLLKILKINNSFFDSNFGMIKPFDIDGCVKRGIEFILEYDLIISTRLHGHILATILGIPNILLDNNYWKNKSFYETWSKGSGICFYAKNTKVIKEIIKNNFQEIYQKIK